MTILNSNENLFNSDTCKSFSSSNRICLNLVKAISFLKGKSLKRLLDIVDKYSDYLPKDNLEFAKIILETRYNTIKERYGN